MSDKHQRKVRTCRERDLLRPILARVCHCIWCFFGQFFLVTKDLMRAVERRTNMSFPPIDYQTLVFLKALHCYRLKCLLRSTGKRFT